MQSDGSRRKYGGTQGGAFRDGDSPDVATQDICRDLAPQGGGRAALGVALFERCSAFLRDLAVSGQASDNRKTVRSLLALLNGDRELLQHTIALNHLIMMEKVVGAAP